MEEVLEMSYSLFCPKCRSVAVVVEGELRCEGTGASLGSKPTQDLIAWTQTPAKDTGGSKFPHRVGGEWYCPCCGATCAEELSGQVECPNCERSLNPLLFYLIELFVHP